MHNIGVKRVFLQEKYYTYWDEPQVPSRPQLGPHQAPDICQVCQMEVAGLVQNVSSGPYILFAFPRGGGDFLKENDQWGSFSKVEELNKEEKGKKK